MLGYRFFSSLVRPRTFNVDLDGRTLSMHRTRLTIPACLCISSSPRGTGLPSLYHHQHHHHDASARLRLFAVPRRSYASHLRASSTPTAKSQRTDQADARRPLDTLLHRLADHQERHPPKKNVLHWFRTQDLRAEDNRALHAASQRARQGTPSHLLTCFVWSPENLQSGPARTDFMLETLRRLQTQLHALNIPLVVLTAESGAGEVAKVLEFVKKHHVSDVFANIQYEVDELRRDTHLLDELRGGPTRLQLLHDQSVVVPGSIKNKPTKGKTPRPIIRYKDYHDAWLDLVDKTPELLDLVDLPAPNDNEARMRLRDLFRSEIPSLPKEKQFACEEDKKRIRKLWPAGRQAAVARLSTFLDTKIHDFRLNRFIPAADATSRLSPYFALGALSVREALQAAKEEGEGPNRPKKRKKKTRRTGRRSMKLGWRPGCASWVSQLILREHHRDTLVRSPPSATDNVQFSLMRWEDDEAAWRRWCEGRTGVPFVDAGMRQLRAEAYMGHSPRVATSKYLRGNLLIDYRRGERFFAESLVDWDQPANTQAWALDPAAPILQTIAHAEKHDPDGTYVRKWVPELRNVHGKAIFAPYERLGERDFNRLCLGYPKPLVTAKASADRYKERYNSAMAAAKVDPRNTEEEKV